MLLRNVCSMAMRVNALYDNNGVMEYVLRECVYVNPRFSKREGKFVDQVLN